MPLDEIGHVSLDPRSHDGVGQGYLVSQEAQLVFQLLASETLGQRWWLNLKDCGIIVEFDSGLEAVSVDSRALQGGSYAGGAAPQFGIGGIAVEGGIEIDEGIVHVLESLVFLEVGGRIVS